MKQWKLSMGVIAKGEQAITEGRDTIQELRGESSHTMTWSP